MKYELISNTGSPRLILIFAGWGMDANVFAHLHHDGYDVAVVWDYRDFGVDWSVTDKYCEICIVAWSLGVYAASMTCHGIESKITSKIAVNGTTQPVNDTLGIPVTVYESTAKNLNDQKLRNFYRRMCGDRNTFARFMQQPPQRNVDELIDELHAIWPMPLLSNPPVTGWDRAFIGRDDAIFPAVNQQRSWSQSGVPVVALDAPHYIDLQKIIDYAIINKEMAAVRFAGKRSCYDQYARVQQRIIDILCERIVRYRIDEHLSILGHAVLEIGTGTGMLTKQLLKWIKPEALHLWDIADDAFAVKGAKSCCCDAEIALSKTLPERFDAIITASTVQWFNSPRKFISECRRVLRPGGWLVISAFAKGNLEEIAQATGRSLPLLPAEIWRDMIASDMELIDFMTYTAELRFDSAIEVFRHLKLTGVNALGQFGPTAMRQAINSYPMRLDGGYYLTYKPFILIARKQR